MSMGFLNCQDSQTLMEDFCAKSWQKLIKNCQRMLAANVQTFAQRNVVVNLIKIYKSDLNFLSNNQCKIF